MHVRIRCFNKPDTLILHSKLTKIEELRRIIHKKLNVEPKLQRLLYGGKLLEDGYTCHDYKIRLNDVIQLIVTSEEKIKTELPKAEIIKATKETQFRDVDSPFYRVNDLVDVKDITTGSWLEGKIVQIVVKSDIKNSGVGKSQAHSPGKAGPRREEETGQDHNENTIDINNENILYKIKLNDDEDDDEDSDSYFKITDIRPRARNVIPIQDLKVDQRVLINYNIDCPSEKGLWYDFQVDGITKLHKSCKLSGTLYLNDTVTHEKTTIKVHDNIYAIEEVVPMKQRNEEYQRMMITQPEKRTQPLKCLTCRDNEKAKCKDCGCCVCSGKDSPNTILLCDECNLGYHLKCMSPPLSEVPEDDWYCSSCKLDPNEVVAPGAAKQAKKTSAGTSRDWGRGMACVGKTKTCSMPPNHFGPIPGIEVGMCWRFRIQLSETGVHRPPVSGIHGRDVEGAYSIVLSGGYEDDVDNGYEFTYTGSGGRNLSGNKRTAEQSSDQTLTRENRALARNCAVKEVRDRGADAGGAWRDGKPVRVVRSYKMLKHFPEYAPREGIRYDGIYKVVKYYPEKGLSGFIVWKYLLRRDDPAPAPWEPSATKYPITYPDGYLEAEKEKKALKDKENERRTKGGNKRRLTTESEIEDSPPTKKHKADESSNKKTILVLSQREQEVIKADNLNKKLWEEALEKFKRRTRKEFLDHITEVFRCIICQDVAVEPVTTECLHNFCLSCLRAGFKRATSFPCPCCRKAISSTELQRNESLTKALRTVLLGYDKQ